MKHVFNQNFLTHHNRIFTNISLPPFWKTGCTCHEITKSAVSETNNKSSDHGGITAEVYNNVYQKTYLNDFRLRILEDKKVLEKSQIWCRQMLVPFSLLVITVKNYILVDFKVT